jgi:hypothetical protein
MSPLITASTSLVCFSLGFILDLIISSICDIKEILPHGNYMHNISSHLEKDAKQFIEKLPEGKKLIFWDIDKTE